MEGEFRIGVLLETPISEWFSLFLSGDEHLCVFPELLLQPADFGISLNDSLSVFLSRYPIGGLRFGGLLSESFSLSLAAQRLLSRALDTCLLKENICDEKRQNILNKFFYS